MIGEQQKAVISAAIVLLVNVAALFGANLDADMAQKVAFGLISIVVTLYGVWKNHNFTSEAVQAQEYLDTLKGKDGMV